MKDVAGGFGLRETSGRSTFFGFKILAVIAPTGFCRKSMKKARKVVYKFGSGRVRFVTQKNHIIRGLQA